MCSSKSLSLRQRSRTPSIQHPCILILIQCALIFGALQHANSQPKFWDGSSSGNWSLGANWTGGIAPVNGDDLIFPATGVARFSVTNDQAGRIFRSITFQGSNYFVFGNSITLSNGTIGISAQNPVGTNNFNIGVTLSNPQSIECLNSPAALDINGGIGLGTNSLTVLATGRIMLGGAISGTAAAALTKNGFGTVRMEGPSSNTYGGATRVNQGTLELNQIGTAIAGDLTVGNGANTVVVRHLLSNQILNTSDVTVNRLATLDLNDQNDAIAALTMAGGTVDTGAGLLTLGGNVTALDSPSTATINGRMSLGTSIGVTRTFDIQDGAVIDMLIRANISGASGAGILKIGPGELRLSGTNTYSGLTTIDDGILTELGGQGLGSTAAGTIVNDGLLELQVGDVLGESLTINRPATSGRALSMVGFDMLWTGPITINTQAWIFSGPVLTIGGQITGPGGFQIDGNFVFGGTNGNTYSGTTTLRDGSLVLSNSVLAIPGPLVIGDGIDAVGTAVVREERSFQIGTVPVTIYVDGLLDLNGFNDTIGSLTLFEGSITTGTGTLSLGGNVTATGLPGGPVDGATISGNLNLGSVERTFNMLSGGTTSALRITAVVSGTGGLRKTGTGSLALSGANLYSGPTTVVDGTLAVENSLALGSAAAGTEVQAGAALCLCANGVNVASEALTLNGDGGNGLGALWSANGFATTWGGVITLATDSAIGAVGAAGQLTLANRVAGSGDLLKLHTGTLVLSGATGNTYGGSTTVDRGTLQLDVSNIAVPHDLIIGNVGGSNAVVLYSQSFQISDNSTITLNSGALLNLNGFSDTVGPLIFNGGDITTGTGTLFMGGNATVNPSSFQSVVSGHVSLPGTRTFDVGVTTFSPDFRINAEIVGLGGIIKTGAGEMALNASNNYAGLTTVREGSLNVEDSFALGATGSGTVVNPGAALVLFSSSHVGLEPLTLSGVGHGNAGALDGRFGSNSWAGNITLSSNATINVLGATDFLNLSGSITASVAADVTKTGLGTLIYSGNTVNSYDDTFVNAGTLVLFKTVFDGAIPGDLHIGDGIGGVNADVVRLMASSEINNLSEIQIASSGLLDMNERFDETGPISGSGRIDIGATTSGTLRTRNDEVTTFSGLIFGDGLLDKWGTGTWILTGNNPITGRVNVTDGTLEIDGSQANSPVTVLSTGTLAGDGVIGDLQVSGNLRPGTSPGVLTSSNVAFASTADFFVELNGPTPGAGYDQLNVRGTNNLGTATLHVVPGPDFAPAEGDEFVILNNDGSDAIVGTFAGLPNNSLITAGGLQFRIRYFDAFANDVVLMFTNPALREVSAQVLSGNLNGVIDPNECDLLNVVLRNPGAASVSVLSATLIPRTPGVSVTQPFSPYDPVPAGGSRTNTTPFQISIMPGFLCGTNVEFTLEVHTVANGNFSLPVSLPSGSVGTTLSFANNTASAIPDLATLNSTVTVSGLATPIKRVIVSLHITHTADSDLDISLIGPDGTTVNLSSDNGGTLSDYGTDCAAGRTVFSDSGLTSIISASAPFVGAFRPEQPLSAFNEKYGSDANGIWTLRIADDTAGGVGTLRCWTLSVSGTSCSDGHGPCESCPERTIFGSITDSDLLAANRINLGAFPASTCSGFRACPGTTAFASHYDAYTFQNGESNACITVTLTADCNLFSAAYRDSFNPADACQDYLADAGSATSSGVPKSYSFRALASQTFVIIVGQANVSGLCDYALDVTGGSCRPVLNITRPTPTHVTLDWSTAAIGYNLERTNALTSPSSPTWVPAGAPGGIVDGRFVQTNGLPGSSPTFYRLRKP